MNILYGIGPGTSVKEIDTLVDLGVTEFFLGVIPPEWRNKYGWEISPNKRTSPMDNFWDYEPAGVISNHIKSKGLKMFIALNEFMYTREQLDDLKDMLDNLEKLNPDAYIVGDISLILQLEKWGIDRPVNVSITAGCLNSYAVNFFKRFKNVRSVSLPRYLSLNEIKKIRRNTDLELTCFAVTGGCEFGEEYCFTFHSDAREVFCNRQFSKKLGEESNGSYTFNPKLRCGLCAVNIFEKLGVDCVKFPSRGHKAERFETLKLVKKACSLGSLSMVKKLQNNRATCKNYSRCAYTPEGFE